MYYNTDDINTNGERVEFSSRNNDRDFPLTTQWEKERGSKIKQAKALFEKKYEQYSSKTFLVHFTYTFIDHTDAL